MWQFNLEGRIVDIDGKKLKIEEQLTEVLDQQLGQRSVLAKARNIENNIISLLRMRYELNPKDFGFSADECNMVMEDAQDHFLLEVQAIVLLHEAGFGPQHHEYIRLNQPEWMPFPGGYTDFIVMKIPPGENLDDIYDELTDSQLASIRKQLANILEKMRQNNYKLVQQHPSYLNYDVRTDKLYLVDLAGLGFTDPKSRKSFPIDEESPYVEAFNIWRAPYRKPEEPTSMKAGKPSASTSDKRKEYRPPWRH